MSGPIKPCPGCDEVLKLETKKDIRRAFVILCKRYELLGEQLKTLAFALDGVLDVPEEGTEPDGDQEG